MDYAQNKAWGDQKEKECAELLQSAYPEIFIRRADVTDVIVPQETMKDIPSQPNFNIFIPMLAGFSVFVEQKFENPIYGWCESTRKTYETFLLYKEKLFVKYKTFRSMQEAHYLIKPLVSRDSITDVVAIRRTEMVLRDRCPQTEIPPQAGKKQIGSGWTAIVNVTQHHLLIKGKEKTADTFLEALVAPPSK